MKKRWLFDRGAQRFDFEDDVFRHTDEPRYARGTHDDGALTMRLGGRDDARVGGMSGGWTRGFELDEPQKVMLTFKFRMWQSPHYERDEYTDVRIAVDGEPVKVDGKPYVARLRGDGDGGGKLDTGWREVTIDLGRLELGRHEFTIGGYSNGKTSKNEVTRYLFDEVRLDTRDVTRAPELGAFEAEVLRLTNRFRERNDLDPLKNDPNLNESAEDWSRNMADGDFFRHSNVKRQIEAFGYEASGWGENIAAGYQTPKAVVDGWIDSPGHRRNMLREDFEHIGIGHYYKSNDGGAAPYGHYWTQIFGVPDDDYLA